MKRIRIILKTIALVLILVLAVQILPLSTLAIEFKNKEMIKEAMLNREVEEEPEIVAEVKSMRDEYTKHFRREDGSFVAEIYNEPIHYEKNGE